MILLLVVLGLCLACSPPCLAIDSTQCSLPDPLPEFSPRECGKAGACGNWDRWNRLEWFVYLDCYDDLVEELDKDHDHDPPGQIPWRNRVYNALVIAAWRGHVNITQAILQRKKMMGNFGFGQSIELAAEFDHPEVLKLLLDAEAKSSDTESGTGLPANFRPPYFIKSPLYAAAKGGYVG